MNLGGNDFANNVKLILISVPAVLFAPILIIGFIETQFLHDGAIGFRNPSVNAIIYWTFVTVSFFCLARWKMDKSYATAKWIRVKASPVNDSRPHQTDGETFTTITVAWKFSFNGKEHEVPFYSRDQFTLDREIYWNPKSNKVMTSFFMNKLAFIIYAVMTTWCALEIVNQSIVPQLIENHLFMVLPIPIGFFIYLEIKSRKAHPTPSQ